jgi:serine protease Do
MLRTSFSLIACALLMSDAPAQSRAAASGGAGLPALSKTLEALASRADASVVQIFVRGLGPVNAGDVAGLLAPESATGSGVILDPAGYIVTNAHVVRGAHTIRVLLPDTATPADESAEGKQRRRRERTVAATLVGMDRESDVAVIKVDAEKLTALELGDSSKLRQGQFVVAMGSPLGLQNSMSFGIVSALRRYLKAEDPMYYIQTDASINPGNSGGPLLDLEGHVVGINTMIFTQSGGNEGIGFAIPSQVVGKIYRELREHGHVHRGSIGVIPQTIDAGIAAGLGLKRDWGVILSDIRPDSAAAAAGLQPGDVVVSVDGEEISNARDLSGAIFHHAGGDRIKMEVQRDGVDQSIIVAVMDRREQSDQLIDLVTREANLVRKLGVLALTLDEKVTPILPSLRKLEGVVVAATDAAYLAHNPGLQPGDVIYNVNRTRVATVEELKTVLAALKARQPSVLQVERLGQLIYVSFQTDED